MTLPVLVVIPTYQERENIEPILARVRAACPAAHVLVVDDGSPDGTGEIADRLAAGDAHVHVLHRTAKAGLGQAYIAGFTWGIDAGYEVLVEMDADGSHAPEQLPRLLEAVDGGADLALGSRYVPGGEVVDWPRYRQVISRGGSWYSRHALGIDIRDVTGGYRAFRKHVLEAIHYQSVASHGYCFQVDLARRAVAAGFRVVEVPITFAEREHGESKMSNEIVREALVRVTQWGWQQRRQRVRDALATRRRSTAARTRSERQY